MAGICFLIALLLGGAASCYAGGRPDFDRDILGFDVCSTSQLFCHHPEYLAYAAA